MSEGGPVTPSRIAVPIDRVEVAAFAVPTDAPESDGTLEWDKTTMVVAHVSAMVRGAGLVG